MVRDNDRMSLNHSSRRASTCGRAHSRRSLAALTAVVISAAALVACGGENPFQATPDSTAIEVDGSALANNDFIPEDQNLSACIGAVQRPECGSDAKGGWRQYLTMGVLVAGLAFIAWRISKGVRARDAVMNASADDPTPAERTDKAD